MVEKQVLREQKTCFFHVTFEDLTRVGTDFGRDDRKADGLSGRWTEVCRDRRRDRLPRPDVQTSKDGIGQTTPARRLSATEPDDRGGGDHAEKDRAGITGRAEADGQTVRIAPASIQISSQEKPVRKTSAQEGRTDQPERVLAGVERKDGRSDGGC